MSTSAVEPAAGSGRVRPRAEDDAQPRPRAFTPADAAELARDVARDAGREHAASADEARKHAAHLSSLLSAVGAQAAGALGGAAGLVEANCNAAREAAAAKVAAARANARASVLAQREQQKKQQEQAATASPSGAAATAMLGVDPRAYVESEEAAARREGQHRAAVAAMRGAASNVPAMAEAFHRATGDLRRQAEEYLTRAVNAEAAAAASSAANAKANAEMELLLQAANRLAGIAGNADVIERDNQRLKRVVDCYETMLTPEQKAAAAAQLVADVGGEAPRSVRRISALQAAAARARGGAANPEAEALLALDAKGASFGEIVLDWFETGKALDETRSALEESNARGEVLAEALAAAQMDAARLKQEVAALEKAALEELQKPNRRGSADAAAEQTIRNLHFAVSAARDEKAIAKEAARAAESARQRAEANAARLAGQLATLQRDAQATAFAEDLATLRAHYKTEQLRFAENAAAVGARAAQASQHSAALAKRLEAAERAAAEAKTRTAQLAAQAAELSKAKAAAEQALAAERAAFAKQLTGKAATASAATKAAVPATQHAKATKVQQAAREQLVQLQSAAATLSNSEAAIAALVQRLAERGGAAVDAAAARGGAAADAEALASIARGVQTALDDTARVRAALAGDVAAKDATITELTKRADELATDLAKANAAVAQSQEAVARVSQQVAETMLGRAVEGAVADCPRCEVTRAETRDAAARSDEAAAHASALQARLGECEEELAGAKGAVRALTTERDGLSRALASAQARLRDGSAALESLTALRERLVRVVADVPVVQPNAVAGDDEDDEAKVAEDAAAPAGSSEGAVVAEVPDTEALRATLEALSGAAANLAMSGSAAEASVSTAAAFFAQQRDAAAAERAEQHAAGTAALASGEEPPTADRRTLAGVLAELWRLALEVKAKAPAATTTTTANSNDAAPADDADTVRDAPAAAAAAAPDALPSGLLPTPPVAPAAPPQPDPALLEEIATLKRQHAEAAAAAERAARDAAGLRDELAVKGGKLEKTEKLNELLRLKLAQMTQQQQQLQMAAQVSRPASESGH